MNFGLLLGLAGVIALSGCVQNDATRVPLVQAPSGTLENGTTSRDYKTPTPGGPNRGKIVVGPQSSATTASSGATADSSAPAETTLEAPVPEKTTLPEASNSGAAPKGTLLHGKTGSVTSTLPTWPAQPLPERLGMADLFTHEKSSLPAAPKVQNMKASATTTPPATSDSTAEIEEVSEKHEGTKSTGEMKLKDQKFYQEVLSPLLQNIRSLHTRTGDRLEALLEESPLKVTETSLPEFARAHREDLLLENTDLERLTDRSVLLLKSEAVIQRTSFEARNPVQQSTLVLGLALAREALEKRPLAGDNTKAQIVRQAMKVSAELHSKKDQLNSKIVEEALRKLDPRVAEAKVDTLDALQVTNELMRNSSRRMTLITTQPESEFKTREATAEQANCRIVVHYQGLEEGLRVEVQEPAWPEFQLTIPVNGNEHHRLRPSAAGSSYLEVEFLQRNSDQSTWRLTLRYQVDPQTHNRKADHLIAEKLPAQGSAEKMLMCRLTDNLLGD